MKVAVIGASGQLGSDVYQAFKNNRDEVVALNHNDIEINDLDKVEFVMKDITPDLVFNAAAMCDVEGCEYKSADAFAVNGSGPRNLAQVSNMVGYTLMHVSTDYVFDGTKITPYQENDCPNPLNVYGNTKLSGEFFVKNISKKYFIIRVSGIYGINPCRSKKGINFVKLMLKLAEERDEVRVVDDEILTPTYTYDIAQQALLIARSTEYGTYHVSAQGSCSWYEFASKIFELTNSSVHLSKANPGEFSTKVQRPQYSVLENKMLQSLGVDIMPPWTDGLERYLQNV